MLDLIKHSTKSKIETFVKYNSVFLREVYSSLMPDNDITNLEYFNCENVIKNEIKDKRFFHYLINFENQSIGIVSLEKRENLLNICKIFILKKYRKQKLSYIILNEIKDIATKENINTIQITINETNKKLAKIVQKWGFEKQDTISRYIGDDIYLYEDKYVLRIHVK